MDFDFPALYKNYSNIELLKVLLHPGEYQTEAVQAATDILARRNVTDDDRRAAGHIIHGSQKEKENNISFNEHPALHQDVLGSFDPENNAKAGLFFKIGLFILCLYYLRLAYISFFGVYYAILFNFFSVKPFIFNLIYLLLLPFALFRLYQRKKDGWIIIVAETIFTFVPALLSLVELWRYMLFESSFSLRIMFFFLEVPFKAFTFFFLWERSTAEYAGISLQHKKVTVLVCIAIIIVFGWLIHMINSRQSF